eukprot:COSAG02_NODE_2030_length_10067_cov_22.885333_14_plen_206_part_00
MQMVDQMLRSVYFTPVVCASQPSALRAWNGAGRIEAARYKHEPQMLLEGGSGATLALTNGDERRGAKRGRNKSVDDSDDDDDDDEEEYRPDANVKNPSNPAKKSKNAPSPADHVAKAPSSAQGKDKVALKPVAGPQGQEARGLVKARRRADGVMEYKVRWHGCEKDADTWVESTSLPAKMIARYEKKMAEKKAAVAAAAAGTGAP